jgi:hypothetical protein
MATIAWPSAIGVQQAAIGLQKAGHIWRGPFNGTAQVVDFVAERWMLSLTLPPTTRANAGSIEALLFRLTQGLDWVQCHHFARPVPRGTMRGSPTLSAQVTRGGTSLPITGGTASGTLKAGDMLGCGGQLFMVRDDITLNGSGAGTVNVVNRVRATIASSTAVSWDKPTATFIVPSLFGTVAFRPRVQETVAMDLEEVW